MSNLPDRVNRSTSLSPLQQSRVVRATRRAQVEVYEHTLRAAAAAEMDQADTQALADAITYAAEEEIRFLDYGLARAAGNPAAAEIVAQKLALLSATNNTRIGRRFR